ncbi:MAG: hypothetical protein LQ346_008331, partial [Caloplaca aetnensis]
MAGTLAEFIPIVENDALYLIHDPRSELNHTFHSSGGSSIHTHDDPLDPMDFPDFVASVGPVPGRHHVDTSIPGTEPEYPRPSRAAAAAQARESPKWQNATAFARTLAVDTAQGSAFHEGVAALSTTIHRHADHHPTPTNLSLASLASKIHTATSTLLSITDAWFRWSQAHHHRREHFGAVHLAGFAILNFVVFRSNLEELSEALDGDVTPLVEDARIFKTE